MTEWKEVRLTDLVDFRKGIKVDVFDVELPDTAPYLGAAALEGEPRHFASKERAVLARGSDVLMLWDGERSGLVGGGKEGVVASTVSRLRPKPGVSPGFLKHALQHRFEWIQARRTGTGVPHVPKDLGTWMKVTLPVDLAAQVGIEGVLNAADARIRSSDAWLAKMSLVRQGLLTDLMTRGVSPDGVIRPTASEGASLYSDGPCGLRPSGWRVGLLDDYAQRGSGHTPNRGVASYWNGGVKWVSLADSSKLDNRFIYETDKEISDAGIANSSAVKHTAGTVILSRDAGVGRSAILGDEMAVSQHFMAWNSGPLLNNVFLYYWLQFMKPQFEAIALGSTIQTIGLMFFRKLKMAVPPLEEQDLVAERLTQLDRTIEVAAAELASLRELRQGVASDLLSGRVRVPEVAR